MYQTFFAEDKLNIFKIVQYNFELLSTAMDFDTLMRKTLNYSYYINVRSNIISIF